MVDYFAFLSRAVADLTTNTAEQREAVYERARGILDARIQETKEPLSPSEIATQTAALEVAIQRVERLAQNEVTSHPSGVEPAIHREDAGHQAAPARQRRPLRRNRWLHAMVGLAGAGSLLALGTAGYWWVRRTPRPAETSALSANYVFLQQPVFYRSMHPAGTLIVDKQQYFLYLVRSNTVALRFGIGVGPECQDTGGLYRISRKDAGAKALLFGAAYRIQGTSAPDGFGHGTASGCFALPSDDATGLYDRTPIDERIIVVN